MSYIGYFALMACVCLLSGTGAAVYGQYAIEPDVARLGSVLIMVAIIFAALSLAGWALLSASS